MNGTNDAEYVSSFLSSAARRAAALLIQGEAGIGKTTVWLAAAEEARLRGFRVLSARASRDEREFAFGIASELIRDVEPDVLGALPETQRKAAERNLLQVSGAHAAHEQRAVVAAFTAIVNKLAETSPVLVAIDDVQWLDAASRDLLAFAARRLRGRVGLLLTERTTTDSAASWLRLDGPDALSRMRVSPMDAGRLQRLITDRVGRSFSRPTMMRVAEVSGGNPFYALQLARAVGDPASVMTAMLPPALAEIIRLRVGHFDDEVKRVLLAAACVEDPTVDVMATITSTSVDRLVQLLEGPETHGVLTIDGNRVRFTHPILAYGIYHAALPAQRRQMHRAMADLESSPEQRARHMALAAVSADAETLRALDVAAATVDADGDPVAAAELVELAMAVGGNTPARRLAAARLHLAAGDLDRCRALAETAAAVLPAGQMRATAHLLIGGTLVCRGDFAATVDAFRRAIADAADEPDLLIRAHLGSAMAYSSLGNGDAAQRHSIQAMTRAEQSTDPHLLSESLSFHVVLQCRRGLGLDRSTLDRAIALEDVNAHTPGPFSARAVDALAAGWTGQVVESGSKITAVLTRYEARGANSDLPWLQFHAAMVDIWLGNYGSAQRTAEDMLLRAEQMGGTHVGLLAAVPAALAAAHTGREQDARKAIEGALADSSVPEGQWTSPWPAMVLGFLEVSLGNYTEALKALQPLLSRWQQAVDADIATHYSVPDAVEAMIATNTLDAAEELVGTLERSGARLSHPWLLAVGARCRGMILAARGDLDGAERAALRAIATHDGLAVPFERARTQLFLGQLQRRMRRRQTSRTTLEAALATFQGLGSSIWAARADAELARLHLLRGNHSELTASEQRVAELAAAGMTNKDIAAALFISPKTVESNLGRVYRKLGIRTRVELGRRLRSDGRDD
jgi:DNA-binding CsgD family transcriptional regulator